MVILEKQSKPNQENFSYKYKELFERYMKLDKSYQEISCSLSMVSHDLTISEMENERLREVVKDLDSGLSELLCDERDLSQITHADLIKKVRES